MYILRVSFKTIKRTKKIKNELINLKKIKIKGNFNIKNKNKIFTLLRSPHVNKKSREHFIFRSHIQKKEIEFHNIIELFNFLINLKKKLTKNFLIDFKIIKNNKMLIA